MRATTALAIIGWLLLAGCRSDVPDRELIRVNGSTMGNGLHCQSYRATLWIGQR